MRRIRNLQSHRGSKLRKKVKPEGVASVKTLQTVMTVTSTDRYGYVTTVTHVTVAAVTDRYDRHFPRPRLVGCLGRLGEVFSMRVPPGVLQHHPSVSRVGFS